MDRFKVSMSKTAAWLALGATLLHAGCGSTSSDSTGAAPPKHVSSSGGSTVGGGGSGGGSSDTSSGGGGTAPGDGTDPGSGGDSGSVTPESGALGSGGDAAASDAATGPGDGSAEASTGGSCVPGDTTPCSSFTIPTGTTIQLGPYGGQMDINVGKGFENQVQSGDMKGNESTCQFFVNLFGEDPKLGTKLLQTTTDSGVVLDFSLYTVYRPSIWPSGPVPVITWGNGTCAQPEGYGALLRYVASYGYVVVAANSRWVGSGTPAPMLHALDFAAAANMDSSSPYYQKLDMTKVGAMGHSQGGQATATAASDSRVQDVIIFNAVDSGVSKPYLTTSGDMDITNFTAQGMASAVDAATVPGAWLYYHNPAGMGSLRGHLVLMLSPERVTGPTVAWWQMMFRNDAASHDMFVGSSCGLCGHTSDFEYGANALLK
jgi:Chlorophyllase enzyme